MIRILLNDYLVVELNLIRKTVSVSLLLANGTNSNKRSDNNETALSFALRNMEPERQRRYFSDKLNRCSKILELLSEDKNTVLEIKIGTTPRFQ